MEKYNPKDTRIHDPELAHELAYITDQYLPFFREAQKAYFEALRDKDSQQEQSTRRYIRLLKEHVADDEKRVLIPELNRYYYETQSTEHQD